MRWVAAWFGLGAVVSFGIGLIQLQGAHDAWIFPLLTLVGAVVALTAIGLVTGWPAAKGLGLLVSAGGMAGGFVILVAFIPILDVVSGGWLLMMPVLAWIAIYAACLWRIAVAIRGVEPTRRA